MEDVEANSKPFTQMDGHTVYVYRHKGKFALWVKINGIRYITTMYDAKKHSADNIFYGSYTPIAGHLYKKNPSFHELVDTMIRYPHTHDL